MIQAHKTITRYSTLTDGLAIGLAVFIAFFILMRPVTDTIVLLTVVLCAFVSLLSPLASLALLVIVAPLRALIATEAPTTFPIDIGQIAFASLVFFWGIRVLLLEKRLPQIRPTPLLIALLGFVSVLTLTAFSALSLTHWLNEWLKWLQMTVLVVILSQGIGQSRQWQWIVWALLCAAAANALVGIYQFFGGSGALHLLVNGRFFRAFGTFGQPNPFGGFMGIIAPLAIVTVLTDLTLLYRAYRKKANLQLMGLWFRLFLFILIAGLIVFALFASWSRGAWLGFMGSFAIMLFALPRKFWQSIALSVVGALLLVAVWQLDLLPSAIESRLSSITAETFQVNDVRGVDITPANYAIVERLAHWQAAIRMAESNTWLGVGAGNYEVAYADYRLINWHEALGHAHNYYLNVLSEAGIMGLIAYMSLWIVVFAVTWRTRNHPDFGARYLAIGLLGSWTYLSIHSLTDNLYVNNLFLHLGVLLGLANVLYLQQNTRHVVGVPRP